MAWHWKGNFKLSTVRIQLSKFKATSPNSLMAPIKQTHKVAECSFVQLHQFGVALKYPQAIFGLADGAAMTERIINKVEGEMQR